MNEPRHATFNAWFDAKLAGDYARDIAEHGADAGYPYISYTADTVVIFDAYADEIWDRAVAMADGLGEPNVCAMIAGFGRADMTETWDSFRNLLVWFACEERAQELMSRADAA